MLKVAKPCSSALKFEFLSSHSPHRMHPWKSWHYSCYIIICTHASIKLSFYEDAPISQKNIPSFHPLVKVITFWWTRYIFCPYYHKKQYEFIKMVRVKRTGPRTSTRITWFSLEILKPPSSMSALLTQRFSTDVMYCHIHINMCTLSQLPQILPNAPDYKQHIIASAIYNCYHKLLKCIDL